MLGTATPDISSSSENINNTALVSRLSFRFLWLWHSSLCIYLCILVSCKACSFGVFCQKKCYKRKQYKKKESERHLDRLISQVQVLSVFYPEISCTDVLLPHNPINLEHLVLHLPLCDAKTRWEVWNLPNKQFQSKSICFPSPPPPPPSLVKNK